MRLNPIAQEARRYRQADRPVVGGLDFHAREPTREYILAKLNAQPVFDPLPALLIRARHFGLLLSLGMDSKRATQARNAPPCPTSGKRNAHMSHWDWRRVRKAKCRRRSKSQASRTECRFG